MPDVTLLTTEELLPKEWRHFGANGPVRAFNPGLLRGQRGWLFAYRIVGPDGLRRIGMCLLDDLLNVIEGSQVPFSDRVCFGPAQSYSGPALSWFADPRLYRFQGRVFLYWNSGWHEPRNYQFLQELSESDFTPIGPPRELLLNAPRRPLEKNWTLFGEETLHAIYTPSPHRVLTASLADHGDIEFTDVATHPPENIEFEKLHGQLRGGAPPQLWDGRYWSFCHSVAGSEGHYRYAASVYCFAGKPPFTPTGLPRRELSLGNPVGGKREFPKLNPAVGEVVYPCGAARHRDRWFVSYGINDERCAIAQLSDDEVTSVIQPPVALP